MPNSVNRMRGGGQRGQGGQGLRNSLYKSIEREVSDVGKKKLPIWCLCVAMIYILSPLSPLSPSLFYYFFFNKKYTIV